MDQNSLSTQTASERRNSSIGIRMTLLYLILYGGFVVLSVFRPGWMGAQAILGLNLAVAYGLGLIIVAVILALVYSQLCRIPRTGEALQDAHTSDRSFGEKGG